MDGVRSVSCGVSTTFAVKNDGTLWAWGFNGDSCLGLGGTGIRDAAIGNAQNANGAKIQNVPIKIMDGAVSVSCGMTCTAAVKADGTLWMWGGNSNGQLDNGGEGNFKRSGFVYQTFPIQVMENVADVRMGNGHTLAIRKDGSLWAWGTAKLLGNGWTGNDYISYTKTAETHNKESLIQTTPVKIMDGVAAVTCSSAQSWAVKTDGSFWA